MSEPMEMSAPLSIRLFGPFDAQVGNTPLPPLRSRRGQWLLALLVLRHGRTVEREWLAGTLWPESDPSLALPNLRRTLTDLRGALGNEAERLTSPTLQTLCLDLSGAFVDVVLFDRLVVCEDVRSLEEAVALYRGPLLEDCAEDWVLREREAREQAYLAALETLSGLKKARGDAAGASRLLHLAIAADPYRESAHRGLMQALAENGDYAAATQAYRELRLFLRRELNAEPSRETEALFYKIREEARQRAERPRPSAPPLPDAPSTRRLPQPITALVGREAEIEQIKGLLNSAPLVTLTGAGGVGKTRLALRVAEEVADDFPDDAWFVDLTATQDDSLVSRAVMAALAVKEEAGRSLAQTLLAYLRPRRLLLVLDNCEHVIEGCAQLVKTLLRECSYLRILATSRQRLEFGLEKPFPVPSLSLPDPELNRKGEPDAATLVLRSEAGRLFVERAKSALRTFTLTSNNARVVAHLCRRLDGIPLALELAAARVRGMTVEQIAQRFDDRFRLLEDRDPSTPHRHQTLRSLMDWSYDLLTEPERALLRRLAVFSGGCTIEAAEEVAGCWVSGVGCREDERPTTDDRQLTGGRTQGPHSLVDGASHHSPLHLGSLRPTPDTRHPTPDEVLDLLLKLLDRSLVVYEECGGEGRYRLLETVRQYGWERLNDLGELEGMRERHRDYFLALAEEAEPHYTGERQAYWLDRIEREHDNFRAALRWSVEGETRLRLAGALWRFWLLRSHYSEGRGWLEGALARADGQTDRAARVKALRGAFCIAFEQGDYEQARQWSEERLALAREMNDQGGIADGYNLLGRIAQAQGRYAEALSLYEQSLAIHRELGDKAGMSTIYNNMGNVTHEQGNYEKACALLEECLRLRKESGDKWSIAISSRNLAIVLYSQGKYAEARVLHEESLALMRSLGDRHGTAQALSSLGDIHANQGDFATARALCEEGLAIRREIGDLNGSAYSLDYLGKITLHEGDGARAQTLFRESLEIMRQVDDRWGIAAMLNSLGNVALIQGDPATARLHLEESLALRQEMGERRGVARVQHSLGYLALMQGDFAEAHRLVREGLRVRAELGDRSGMAEALHLIACLSVKQEIDGGAARLFGAEERLRAEIGVVLPPLGQTLHPSCRDAARAALGEAAFDAAIAEGRAMTIEEAIAMALA